MRNTLIGFTKHPLISGSAVIFFGTLLGNVFNLFFSIYMYANLPEGDKGTLLALISLITLPSLAASAIGPSIISFAGSFFAKKQLEKVKGLYSQVGKLYLIIAVCLFVLFLLLIPQVKEFFKISSTSLLVMANFCILISFLYVINTSFLQAKLSFGYISLLSILSALIKFGLGILFVMLGWALEGATFALLISFLVVFLLSFVPLRFVFQKGTERVRMDTKELTSYGIPAAIIMFGLTSFITLDLLLVKHFFGAHQADVYAGVSLIGRIIFYFSAPIGTVMFPLIVQKRSQGENYNSIFAMSLMLVLLPSLLITVVYTFFPDLIMNVFNINLEYYETYFLTAFGIFISMYALITIIINFYLSIKKTAVWLPVIAAAFGQSLLIWFFHDSFLMVTYVSIGVTFVLLCSLLLYYPYATKK